MNLADHIAAHALRYDDMSDRTDCLCGWSINGEDLDYSGRVDLEIDRLHAAHVAETWAEHRTITTLDQLRELPDYVVIADAGGNPWIRGAFGWRSSGLERGHSSISLPARILHNPEEDQ